MSSDWVNVKIGEVAQVVTKGTTPTTLGHEFKDSGVNFVKSESITFDGWIDRSKFTFIDNQAHAALKRSQLNEDDILFSMAGVYIGKTAVVPKDILPANTNQAVGIIRLDPTKAFARFIDYYLRNPSYNRFINNLVAQSAQPNLNLSEIKNLPIKLPSVKEQRAICTVLGALDNRITLLRETNATLEAIAQALFKSWFVDFDPVHAKQQGRAPEGMDEATAALFPDSFEESELGLVPRGWRVDVLEMWLAILESGRRPKGGVSGINKGVPSIGAESIIRIGEFDFAKTKYVSHEFFGKMKAGVLESHDVLLYKDGGKPGVFLPRVSMFGEGFPFANCGINEHVFRVRLKEPFNQTFLYFWLWSDAIMHELKHRGGKAAIPGINQADVKEQRLLIPDKLILQRFNDLTSSTVSQIFNNAKKIQNLKALRDTLLPRLISGKLRLPVSDDLLESDAA